MRIHGTSGYHQGNSSIGTEGMCILLKYKQIHSSLIHFKPETTPKEALLPSEKTLYIIIEGKKVEFESLRANKPCNNLHSYLKQNKTPNN